MLNKQHLPILKAARDIVFEKDGPICSALDEVPASRILIRDVKLYIAVHLAPRNLMSTWLLEQMFPNIPIRDVPEPYLGGYCAENGVLTLARLAWLDRIIADIEEQSC
jgi:hypothetical protein